MRRLPKNLTARLSLSLSKYYGDSFSDTINGDLSWDDHSRVNNVTHDEDELAVTAADVFALSKNLGEFATTTRIP